MLNCLIPVTPLTHIPTRSVAFNVAAVQLWLGRWALLDSSGLAIPPGSPGAGLGGAYLVWGSSHAVPDGLAAGAYNSDGSLVDPTQLFSIPDAMASGQVGLMYGIFRATVQPVGFVAGSIAIGDGLELDAAGRLIKRNAGVRVATCEAISASALTFRTLGA